MFARGTSVYQKCFNYALTNLFFGVCKSVWIIDPFVTCLSRHPEALAHLSTFEMLQTRERTPTLYPFVLFTFGLVIKFIKEFRGASLTLLHVFISICFYLTPYLYHTPCISFTPWPMCLFFLLLKYFFFDWPSKPTINPLSWKIAILLRHV